VGLFRLSDPAAPEYTVRLRGVAAGRRYRVRFDNSGDEALLDGHALASAGLTIRLEAPLTSELLLVQEEL
jgi:hypothetical protein